ARGMKSLITKLAAGLPPNTVQLNTQVAAITRSERNWDLLLNPQSAIRNPQSTFEAIILAVPSYVAARLLQSCSPSLAGELAAIEYAGCAVVSFGFHRRQVRHSLDGFGFVVPHVERRRIIAASFASLKFPGRSPADDVLVRVFLGGALQPELLDLTDAELSR